MLRSSDVLPAYCSAIAQTAEWQRMMEMPVPWIHLGLGCSVPTLMSAKHAEGAASSVTAFVACGRPFTDAMTHHLLSSLFIH